VVQFGIALSDLLVRLQGVNPEACWAFAHEGPDVTEAALPKTALEAITAAEVFLSAPASDRHDHGRTLKEVTKAAADLVAFIREKDLIPTLQGLRLGAEHAAFCPSLHRLLETALALPERHRAGIVRAVLSAGGQ
jgi:hypothetical protein